MHLLSGSLDRIEGNRRERPVNGDRAAPRQAAPGILALPAPSRRSMRGLDWFIFFLADVQTGFGPFIAVYLTTQKWTQAQIGLVLSIGGVVALIGQMPGGAIVDAARSERLVAALAIATIGCAALAYAAWPIFPVVVAAATLHAAASCVLGPAIAAISLGLVGPHAMGERLGRNARFASLGNGVAAAAMGTAGYLISSRSVFLVTFLLAIPTLLALGSIRESEVDVARCHGAVLREDADAKATSIFGLLRQRDGVVELAGGGRGLRLLHRVLGRDPLVLQRRRALVGGLGLGVGGVEVVGRGGRCRTGKPGNREDDRKTDQCACAHDISLRYGRAPGPEIGSPFAM